MTVYHTPSGRLIEYIERPRLPKGPPPTSEHKLVTAEFEKRKTQAEIDNEKFLAALDLYFRNGGRA